MHYPPAYRFYLLIIMLSAIVGCSEENEPDPGPSSESSNDTTSTNSSYCLNNPVVLFDSLGNIEGNSLFILSDGEQQSYSRNGSLCVDENGKLRHPSGKYFQLSPNNSNESPLVLIDAEAPLSSAGIPLESIYTQLDGTVIAHYSDYNELKLGHLPLARFNSPQNLLEKNHDVCEESDNSGTAHIALSGTEGVGLIPGSSTSDISCAASSIVYQNFLTINKKAFLQLNRGESTRFTQLAELQMDKYGYLSDSNGLKLQAYPVQSAMGPRPQAIEELEDIQLPIEPIAASATTSVSIWLNLDASSTPFEPTSIPFTPSSPESYHHKNSLSIYDSQSMEHTLETYYRKILPTESNLWEMYVTIDQQDVPADGNGAGEPVLLTFDTAGNIASSTPGDDYHNIAFSTFYTLEGEAIPFNLDVPHILQYKSPSTDIRLYQNGFSKGYLSGVNIDVGSYLRGIFDFNIPTHSGYFGWGYTISPAATDLITLSLNLNAWVLAINSAIPFSSSDSNSYHHSSEINVYDSLGGTYSLRHYYRKIEGNNQWELYTELDNKELLPIGLTSGQPVLLSFDEQGTLTSLSPSQQAGIVNYQAVPITGADNLTLNADFSSTTQLALSYSEKTLKQNGTEADISGYHPSPIIRRSTYKYLYQIPAATFANPDGLEDMDNGLYRSTEESGSANLSIPNSFTSGPITFIDLSGK